MKRFRSSVTQPKSSARRRASKDSDIYPPILFSRPSSKRPSLVMLPRDSATSLASNPSPTAGHRRIASQEPCCPKQPGLEQILAGTSEKPWTLQAFQAYCEQNLCAENLLFIQEAKSYMQAYRRWRESEHGPLDSTSSLQVRELVSQWRAMLAHFIATGGPQEVNLTGDVRDALLAVPYTSSPADPSLLDPAVALTQRLIEDSILFPFLNDTRHDCVNEQRMDVFGNPKDTVRSKSEAVAIDPPSSRPSSRGGLTSPLSNSNSFASGLFHMRSTRQPRSSSRPKSMFVPKDASVSSGGTSIDAILQDESSTSATSPSTTYTTSQTPPTSPPASECGTPNQRSRSDSSGWKKFGARFGLAKKRGSSSQLRAVRTGESALSD